MFRENDDRRGGDGVRTKTSDSDIRGDRDFNTRASSSVMIIGGLAERFRRILLVSLIGLKRFC